MYYVVRTRIGTHGASDQHKLNGYSMKLQIDTGLDVTLVLDRSVEVRFYGFNRTTFSQLL